MLVALMAGLGSVLRYLVDRAVPAGHFPRGTVLVNTTGSFALGLMAGALHGPVATVLGVGLLGGYTTLSTYAVETVALVERGRWRAAGLNVLLSAGLGLAAAAAGLGIAAQLRS